MNWQTIITIARKDIVDALRNNSIVGMLMVPVLASILLRFIFPTANADTEKLVVLIYDPTSSRFVGQLRSNPALQVLDVSSSSVVLTEVQKQNASGGIVVPDGFDQAVDSGMSPDLTVYLNQNRNSRDKITFQQLIEQEVLQLRPLPANIVWTDTPALAFPQPQVPFNFGNFLFNVTLVMTLSMIGGLIVPLLLVEEKERKTMEFLLVSPADPSEIVMGKTLTGLFYNLLAVGVLLGLNHGWRGNWLVTLIVILLGILFMVAVGLLMGSFFRNTIQVNTWGSMILLILMVPGMLATGSNLSTSLETIIRITPTYRLIKILNASLAGESTIGNIWRDIILLGGYVVIALTAVVWSLRRKER